MLCCLFEALPVKAAPGFFSVVSCICRWRFWFSFCYFYLLMVLSLSLSQNQGRLDFAFVSFAGKYVYTTCSDGSSVCIM